MPTVVLASASPRRRELLARLVWPFEVRPAEIDEARRPGEEAAPYARRMAEEKARAGSDGDPSAWVLGADTIVVCDGDVLGKPADRADAARMLRRLAGRTHEVRTAIAWARRGQVLRAAEATAEVSFRPIAEAEIDRYVATGEPLDKAGAYAIQGEAGRFVLSARGPMTAVIGLPLAVTERLAHEAGVPLACRPLSPEATALRYRAVAGEVAALAVAAGRAPSSVQLVAVSKGHPAERVRAALDAGARVLGENYVQEAAAKRAALGEAGDGASWHLIGPLQRNKVAAALRVFDVVQTLDRLELARAIEERAATPQRVLLQVNVAGDPAKAGVSRDGARQLLAELARFRRLDVRGLMTIGPADVDPATSRHWFDELRATFDDLRELGYERIEELSMGMSGDYPEAIAAGATMVRIGTAIFGERERPGGRGEG